MLIALKPGKIRCSFFIQIVCRGVWLCGMNVLYVIYMCMCKLLTSSKPLLSVIVDVFTIGSSTPSISTQLPAGTRFTSILYLYLTIKIIPHQNRTQRSFFLFFYHGSFARFTNIAEYAPTWVCTFVWCHGYYMIFIRQKLVWYGSLHMQDKPQKFKKKVPCKFIQTLVT